MNTKVQALADKCAKQYYIDPALYTRYNVKRGLRDISGQGVLAGLTRIAEVKAYTLDDGELIPCEGKLYYQGYDLEEVVDRFAEEKRFGFEEAVYLLLFGELPETGELAEFKKILSERRVLPPSFVRDVIMHSPSRDIMNSMARSVLTLYSYDNLAEDTSVENVLRQSLDLIAQFPRLAVYGYQARKHYHDDGSLVIHMPPDNLSTAEVILHTLRDDMQYTELEAKVLDIALVTHADHGGGNNSTFTARVVTSSGTDTYSAVAAAMGSLKGPRHGGANIKVSHMFDDIKQHVKNWNSDAEVRQYIADLVDKKAFDKSGLVYGIGHAVYSLSDPRAKIFSGFAEKLAVEKGLEEEFHLYKKVEALSPEVIGEKRKIYKGVSANVDFYSGFVYKMLGLPEELYTPIFAIARIAGWCAHRIEEIAGGGKIIRPAYKNVLGHRPLGAGKTEKSPKI